MNQSNLKTNDALLSYGRILLFIPAILYTLVIGLVIILLLANGREAFMLDDFGAAWAMLSQNYPHVAEDFFHMMKNELIGLLSVGLFSLTIITFAFKRGNRWAWCILWLLPAIMIEEILHAIKVQTGLEYLFGGFALFAVFGLLISYGAFFPRKVN